MKIRPLAALLAASMTLAAAGCGDDDTGAEPAAAEASGPVAITDQTGKRIELDAPAQRVVTIEWDNTENVLALGVKPVGVADKAEYRDWLGAGDPIPADVPNVGTRSEASVEKIAALKPDLIVAAASDVAKTRKQLERIAPVAVFAPYDTNSGKGEETEWAQTRDQVTKLGTLLGKEDEAEALLERLDTTIEEQKARIAEAGAAGDSVVITQAYTAGKPVARLFDSGSAMLEVVRRLGLRNGFDGKHQPWSITEVGLEGLQQVGDADWLLTLTQEKDDPFETVWAKNPAFTKLPVVKAGRVRELGGDTWTWGGPLSLALLAERIGDALTAEAPAS